MDLCENIFISFINSLKKSIKTLQSGVFGQDGEEEVVLGRELYGNVWKCAEFLVAMLAIVHDTNLIPGIAY